MRKSHPSDLPSLRTLLTNFTCRSSRWQSNHFRLFHHNLRLRSQRIGQISRLEHLLEVALLVRRIHRIDNGMNARVFPQIFDISEKKRRKFVFIGDRGWTNSATVLLVEFIFVDEHNADADDRCQNALKEGTVQGHEDSFRPQDVLVVQLRRPVDPQATHQIRTGFAHLKNDCGFLFHSRWTDRARLSYLVDDKGRAGAQNDFFREIFIRLNDSFDIVDAFRCRWRK